MYPEKVIGCPSGCPYTLDIGNAERSPKTKVEKRLCPHGPVKVQQPSIPEMRLEILSATTGDAGSRALESGWRRSSFVKFHRRNRRPTLRLEFKCLLPSQSVELLLSLNRPTCCIEEGLCDHYSSPQELADPR